MEERVFKIKAEQKSVVIPSFRVTPEVYDKIKAAARTNGTTVSEVIRQMIEFALESSKEGE